MGQKRTVMDKNLGRLVKAVMTGYIHCTRCVRYAGEVAGVEDLGVTGRGGAGDRNLHQQAHGVRAERQRYRLVPVGALTSKPYAFTARQWELKPMERDGERCPQVQHRVDSRGTEVLRILPRAVKS